MFSRVISVDLLDTAGWDPRGGQPPVWQAGPARDPRASGAAGAGGKLGGDGWVGLGRVRRGTGPRGRRIRQ